MSPRSWRAAARSGSTQVLRIMQREFGGQTVSGLVVYTRPGGLTPADRARIIADAARAIAFPDDDDKLQRRLRGGLQLHRHQAAARHRRARARAAGGDLPLAADLPVTFVFDIGFIVAVGILLDTFIVRTIMVPALVELLGDRIWWPSNARGGGHALHEGAEVEERPKVVA
jgi:uncharacterized membrane protein YdfJ with MMPL/SSD domain